MRIISKFLRDRRLKKIKKSVDTLEAMLRKQLAVTVFLLKEDVELLHDLLLERMPDTKFLVLANEESSKALAIIALNSLEAWKGFVMEVTTSKQENHTESLEDLNRVKSAIEGQEGLVLPTVDEVRSMFPDLIAKAQPAKLQ